MVGPNRHHSIESNTVASSPPRVDRSNIWNSQVIHGVVMSPTQRINEGVPPPLSFERRHCRARKCKELFSPLC